MQPADMCAIAVMAKAPRAGQVKTRLCPPLTPEAATRMSAAFLRDITTNLALAGREVPIHGFVAYAPAGMEARFDGMLAPGTRLVLADGASMAPGVTGFGRCLLQAVQQLFARGYGFACVLNADSPTLPTSVLVELARRLAAPGDRCVLGAAEDGGYYALGVKQVHAGLFADIDWSTGRVAEQTRERARGLRLDLVELPVWYDVDDRAALDRLVSELSGARRSDGRVPYAAPATAACVRALDLPALLAAVV